MHDLALEPRAHGLEEGGLADQETGFEKRRAHRHVGAGLVEALIDGAGRMTDLLAEIPQHIQDRLDDGLAAPGGVVRQQEKQVDVGAGRKRRAAVAADRGDDADFAEAASVAG